MKKNFGNVMTIFGITMAAILLLIVVPFILFWCAYFGGWLASITIGNSLCEALNTLFNTKYFKPEMLPMCAGALGWIGGFFKSVNTIRSK